MNWDERIAMISIHPDAATRDDTARLAAELMATMARVRELEEAARELFDATFRPPDPNCSCHIAGPCHDCETWEELRAALAAMTAALAGRKE